MPFCRECGKPVEDEWNTCPFCSAAIGFPSMSTEVSDSVVMGDINNNQSTINIHSLNISSEIISQHQGTTLQNAISRYVLRNVELKEELDLSDFIEWVECELEAWCEDMEQFDQLIHELQFLKLGHEYSINCPSDWSFHGFNSYRIEQELLQGYALERKILKGEDVGEIISPWIGNEFSGGLYKLVGYDLVSKWVFINLTKYEAVEPDESNPNVKYKLITGKDCGLYAITLKEFSIIYKNSNQMICKPPLGITDWKKRRIFS